MIQDCVGVYTLYLIDISLTLLLVVLHLLGRVHELLYLSDLEFGDVM